LKMLTQFEREHNHAQKSTCLWLAHLTIALDACARGVRARSQRLGLEPKELFLLGAVDGRPTPPSSPELGVANRGRQSR
jgi:hypothetical protein